MRRTQHKLIAVIPHGDPDIGAEVECEITFTFTPGVPVRMYGTPQPAEDATIDFVSAAPIINGKPSSYGGAYADMEQSSLDAIAFDWLEDEGLVEAFEVVAADDADAREYAAELRADR